LLRKNKLVISDVKLSCKKKKEEKRIEVCAWVLLDFLFVPSPLDRLIKLIHPYDPTAFDMIKGET
jgi:hypothetical protein